MFEIRRAVGMLVLVGAIAWAGAASAQPIPQAKCEAGKIKCGINKVKGNLGCEGKAAKLGATVDPLCTQKVNDKFSGLPLNKSCMEKLDAKNATVPCLTLGDGSTIGAKINAFVADVKAELYVSPAPTGANACASGKMKCVTNFVKGILGCDAKAITTGLPVDPLCLQKAMDKFTGLPLNKSCMEKGEAAGKPCTLGGTLGDGAAIKAKSQAFMDDLLCELGGSPTGTQLHVTTAAGSGTCGVSRTGGAGGTDLLQLDCGSSYQGGGTGNSDPSVGPVGALTRYTAACAGTSCTLGPTTAGTGANTCSSTGCPYGPNRPQPNTTTPVQSACVRVLFSAPAAGSVNSCTGAATFNLPLSANITLTANATEPCPLCVAGVCDAQASNAGAGCTDLGGGLNYECLPLGLPLPPFAISTPASGTGTSVNSNAGGIFCPGQTVANKGCFGDATCDYMEATGAPAGPLSPGPHSIITGSVFCIPSTGNGLIDTGAGFPGPGANSTPATIQLLP